MTVKEVMCFPEITPSSFIVLASNEAYMKFMTSDWFFNNGNHGSDELNIVGFAAEEVTAGGKYYSLIKDLRVTDVVPFKDDNEEECYAVIVDISEDQIIKIKKTFENWTSVCEETNAMITM